MPIFTQLPLDRMELTQAFGRDFTGPDGKKVYAKMGLKGHNGWDLACTNGSPVYAVADGYCEYVSTSGYGNSLWLHVPGPFDTQYQIVYGHLQEPVKTGNVQKGDVIALSDNTGMSTGPHLHWAPRQRKRSGSGWEVMDHDNGYFGYLDPALFFPKTVFDIPVDAQYGHDEYTPGVPSWWDFQKTNAWFFKTFKRLMTTREMKAFRFGFWDIHTVLNKQMSHTWWYMDKPTAQAKGLIK